MITKNSDLEIQNLIKNQKSWPFKSNPEGIHKVFSGTTEKHEEQNI